MFDFGIKKFILQILLLVLGAIIVLSAMALEGCESKQTAQTAFVQKNVEETNDDSVNISGEAILTVDPLELIQAKADAKVETIRASEEKWRILAWVGGIGAVIVGILALLIRSPLDRKERNA